MSITTTVLAGIEVCVACVVCASSLLFFCLLLPFTLFFFRESRLAACCHHPHRFLFQLTRSGTLRSFGNNNTIATKLFPERLLIAKIPICELFVSQIGAIFTITVYLTASAGAVLTHVPLSPTSSSQALKRDSKPLAGSHQSFASIMIFCITAY